MGTTTMRFVTNFVVIIIFLGLGACATSPTGRSQLRLFPESEMAQLGAAAFTQVQEQTPVAPPSKTTAYVRCVADAITGVVRAKNPNMQWDVKVFQADDTINAFALPGGHIGVYTGLLKVTQNAAQLAAVIGHEVGHVMANHANARLSTQYATQAGLALTGALLGGDTSESRNIMGLLGVGAQVGIILPFTRSQETEADKLGLRYMAQAGFDPQQSVDLWRNMEKAGGAQPPEFLSTHPSHGSRIQTLQNDMPQAMQLYHQARQRGRLPDCHKP